MILIEIDVCVCTFSMSEYTSEYSKLANIQSISMNGQKTLPKKLESDHSNKKKYEIKMIESE